MKTLALRSIYINLCVQLFMSNNLAFALLCKRNACSEHSCQLLLLKGQSTVYIMNGNHTLYGFTRNLVTVEIRRVCYVTAIIANLGWMHSGTDTELSTAINLCQLTSFPSSTYPSGPILFGLFGWVSSILCPTRTLTVSYLISPFMCFCIMLSEFAFCQQWRRMGFGWHEVMGVPQLQQEPCVHL